MQPHAELVECEGEAEAVGDRAPPALALAELEEKHDARDRAEQKDAVVEMVHVRAAHVQEKIRHQARHDQDHQHARRDEGEQEDGKDDAREMAHMRPRRRHERGLRFR